VVAFEADQRLRPRDLLGWKRSLSVVAVDEVQGNLARQVLAEAHGEEDRPLALGEDEPVAAGVEARLLFARVAVDRKTTLRDAVRVVAPSLELAAVGAPMASISRKNTLGENGSFIEPGA